jgi:Domain of Unknown Function (DUF1080)
VPNQLVVKLDEVPTGSVENSVIVEPHIIEGRQAVRVTLTEAARTGVEGIAYIDMPTFLILPIKFSNGTISVDIRSRLRPDAPEYARGFAGLAYRVNKDADRFEAVYIRPLNGRKLTPASPRDVRAVQYFSFPNWKFDALRTAFPDGRYEAGADIEPDCWTTLKIEVHEKSVRVMVNDVEVLYLNETLGETNSGNIGLWVDIGTEAFFSNLLVLPNSDNQF